MKQTHGNEVTPNNGINFDSIRNTSFLKDIPRITFARIVKYLSIVEFAPGENVITEGAPGDSLFILQEGTLEVFQGSNDDRRVLGFIKEGSTFGEIALLTNTPRSTSVVAISSARLIKFTKEGFEKIISETPSIYPIFIQSIIGNLKATNAKYCQVSDMFTSDFEKATRGVEGKKLLAFIAKIMAMPFFSPILCQDFLAQKNTAEILKKLRTIPAAVVENEDGTCKLSIIFSEFLLSNELCQQTTDTQDLFQIAQVLRKHHYFQEAIQLLLRIEDFTTAADIISSQLPDSTHPQETKKYHGFLNEIPSKFLQQHSNLKGFIPSPVKPSQTEPKGRLAFGKNLIKLNTAYKGTETSSAKLLPATKLLGWGLFLAIFSTLFIAETPSTSFTVIALCAITMWAFELVDPYMVTIFLLISCLGKNVAEREIIFSGFTSDSFFLTLGVFALSNTFFSSGLVLRMALWILTIVPFRPLVINCTLAFIGLLITPVLTSANGRLALISPILLEMMDSVGYKPNSPCTRRIAMSTLTGFALTSCLFLTGKPIHLVVHGMLPTASAVKFTWGYWFLAALVPSLMIFFLNLISATFLNNDATASQHTLDKTILKTQLHSLGRLFDSTREFHVILAIIILLGGAMTSSLHGLGTSWFAMLSMFFLMLTGGIDMESFKSKIDWPFLFFLAGIISFVRIFNHLGMDDQISSRLVFLSQLIDYNILIFLMALSLVVFAVRFLLPNNVTIVLLSTILIPIAVQAGISPWVVCFTIIVTSNAWFLPYQCTFNMTFYSMTAGQLFQHRHLTNFLLINALIAMAAIAASTPIWRLMGLL